MKQTLLLLLIFLLSASAFAQDILIPFRAKDKWGCKNTKGEFVVLPKYEATYPLLGKRVRFKDKGKYGYLNSSGKVVIAPTYDTAYDFSLYNQASVSIGDNKFYIDTLGNKRKPIYYCSGGNSILISHQKFHVNGKYGIKEFGGDTILKPLYKNTYLHQNYNVNIFSALNDENKLAIFSTKGEQLSDFEYDKITVNNPYFPRCMLIEKNGKMGATDINGKIIVLPKYENISYYNYCLHVTLANGKTGFVYNGREYWTEKKN